MNDKIKINNQSTPEDIKEYLENLDKELPQDIEKAIEKENTEENKDIEDTPEDVSEVIDNIEVKEEEEPEVIEEEEVVTKDKPEVPPIEERYKNSTQESLILSSKNKKFLETIEEAESLNEPTEEEVRTYSKELGEDYDNLDKFTQNMLRENLINKKKFSKISDLYADEKEQAKWIKKVDTFLEDIKTKEMYPSVVTKSEEFKKYCAKKTHRNADFELLVAGFTSVNMKPTYNKSVLLQRGGGNLNRPKPSSQLTQDDAQVIRNKSQKDYMEMARKGKFKVDV